MSTITTGTDPRCTCIWAGDPRHRPKCPVHEPECPLCAAFRAKLDREKLAIVMCGGKEVWDERPSKDWRDGYRADAARVIAYFEGKQEGE